MKLPLKIDKKTDLEAVKWLVKFWLVWFVIARLLWQTSLVQSAVENWYAPVVAKIVAFLVSLLGFETWVREAVIYVQGSRLAFHVTPDCTGLYGGFFIFLAVVLTLPAPSWKARLSWASIGVTTMIAANALRLTAVAAAAANNPESFDPIHEASDVFNMLVGFVLSILAVKSLALDPRGIKLFKRRPSKQTASDS